MASPVDTSIDNDGYVSYGGDCNGCCSEPYGEKE